MAYSDTTDICVEIAGREFIATVEFECMGMPTPYSGSTAPYDGWDYRAQVKTLCPDTGHKPPKQVFDCPEWLSDAIVETYGDVIEEKILEGYAEMRANRRAAE